MSTVSISPALRLALRTSQRVRNGLHPAAFTQSRFNDDANFIAKYCTKAIEFRCPISAIPTLSTVSRTRWRGMIHTSPHTKYIWVRFLMAQIDDSGGDITSFDPFGRVLLELPDGTDIGTANFHWGYSVTANDTPSAFGTGTTRIADTNGIAVEVDGDTDYQITVTDEQGARIIGVSIYEETHPSDTANGYLDVRAVAGGPIFANDREDVVGLLRTSWKRQASPLITWASNTDASAPSRTGSSVNIITGAAATPVSAATLGWTIDLRNRSTVRRAAAGVPVKWWVYASRTSGTAQVQLLDSGGTALSTILPSSSTPAWYSASVDLPATLQKLDIVHDCSGGGTVTTYAASLWQYEA